MSLLAKGPRSPARTIAEGSPGLKAPFPRARILLECRSELGEERTEVAYHVRVRWDELRRAYDQGSAEARYFLDVQTGDILPIFVDIIERGGNPEDARRIAAGVNIRYFLIPHKSSHEGYEEMEEFIGTVKEKRLHQALLDAIEGKGAFRRFREVLVSYPVEEERWLSERDARVREELTAWLEKNDILLEES
jgi:hypothetical protein